MADVKIGLNQTSKPAPLGYRKFANAYTIMFTPAFAGFIAGWGFSDGIQKKALVILAFSVALVKGLGMVLGNGQIYSPSNQVVEDQSGKN